MYEFRLKSRGFWEFGEFYSECFVNIMGIMNIFGYYYYEYYRNLSGKLRTMRPQMLEMYKERKNNMFETFYGRH